MTTTTTTTQRTWNRLVGTSSALNAGRRPDADRLFGAASIGGRSSSWGAVIDDGDDCFVAAEICPTTTTTTMMMRWWRHCDCHRRPRTY